MSLAQWGSQFGHMLAQLKQAPRSERMDNVLVNAALITHRRFARPFLRDHEVTASTKGRKIGVCHCRRNMDR